MFTFNGTGTRLYGKRDQDADGWYIATKFFCVLYLPLLPLSAYRVRRLESTGFFLAGHAKYEMYPVDGHVTQARNVYLAAYLPLAAAFLLAQYFR